jgi:hypothetical protein
MTDSVILLEKETWWHLVILRFLIKKKADWNLEEYI